MDRWSLAGGEELLVSQYKNLLREEGASWQRVAGRDKSSKPVGCIGNGCPRDQATGLLGEHGLLRLAPVRTQIPVENGKDTAPRTFCRPRPYSATEPPSVRETEASP